MTINKDIYEIINTLTPKDNGYLFDTDGFQQSAKLAKLLKKLDIPRTTFHGLRDTHASFLFSNDNIRGALYKKFLLFFSFLSKHCHNSYLQKQKSYYYSDYTQK